jgi:steroid delta-isomerase-like uncharacterized protein
LPALVRLGDLPSHFNTISERSVVMAQSSVLNIVDTAKATILAYNDKNWDAVRKASAPNLVYDEVATARNVRGLEDVLKVWQGWAEAIPDSKATFQNELVSGNTVVLELTWRGTHTGPLQTPAGTLQPTGKKINLRAVQIIQMSGDKTTSVRQYFDMATLLQQLGVSR